CIYDENGAIFIDRSPEYFEYILKFMREGELHSNITKNERLDLLNEASYYKFKELKKALKNMEEDCFDLENSLDQIATTIENIQSTQEKVVEETIEINGSLNGYDEDDAMYKSEAEREGILMIVKNSDETLKRIEKTLIDIHKIISGDVQGPRDFVCAFNKEEKERLVRKYKILLNKKKTYPGNWFSKDMCMGLLQEKQKLIQIRKKIKIILL
uniref:Potassium channel tetramerisation-type BTB domain-containing protein n=1 Tax=Acrobeloides nanus TaxID=290746 RepID=A0A914CS08_9BILA